MQKNHRSLLSPPAVVLTNLVSFSGYLAKINRFNDHKSFLNVVIFVLKNGRWSFVNFRSIHIMKPITFT